MSMKWLKVAETKVKVKDINLFPEVLFYLYL